MATVIHSVCYAAFLVSAYFVQVNSGDENALPQEVSAQGHSNSFANCTTSSDWLLKGRGHCCHRIHQTLLDARAGDEELRTVCAVFLTPEENNPLKMIATRSGQKHQALFSSMVSYWLDGPWPRGPPIETAIRLALWHINFCADLPVLSDYYLTTRFFDSGCDASRSSRAFMDIIHQEENLGIIGPGCSVSTFPTAAFASIINETMISYSTEAFALSDRHRYSTYYRLSASGVQFQATWKAFITHFGWNRIGILLQLGHEFDGMVTKCKRELIELGKEIVLEEGFLESGVNVSALIRAVQRKDAEVLIAAVYPPVARQLMCLAYKRGVGSSCCNGGRSRVWIYTGWFADGWWNTTVRVKINNSTTVTCSKRDMLSAAGGSFAVNSQWYDETDQRLDLNSHVHLNATYWKKLQHSLMHKCWPYVQGSVKQKPIGTDYVGYVYDTVWTYAHALNQVYREHTQHSDIRKILTRKSGLMSQTVQKLQSFTGISGNISFLGADRPELLVHLNNINQNGKEVVVGKATLGSGRLTEVNEASFFWGACCRPGVVPNHDPTDKAALKECNGEFECWSVSKRFTSVGLPILLISLLSIFVLVYRRRKRRLRMENQLELLTSDAEKLLSKESNVFCLCGIDEKWLIDCNRIELGEKIGEGEFGNVFKGVLQLLGEESGVQQHVAVKMMKTGPKTLPVRKVQFLTEAKIMSTFDSSHVVELLGVGGKENGKDADSLFIVMELMELGNLRMLLISSRLHVGDGSEQELTSESLTKAALDVARGLAYLVEMRFVHCDLAARNCLVAADQRVKISDFGLARPAVEEHYQTVDKNGADDLAVRWMAPETICDGLFTHASDVWSFGVLTWELATLGATPFPSLPSEEVSRRMKEEHLRISPPTGSSKELQRFLHAIWKEKEEERLTVSEIIDELDCDPEIINVCGWEDSL